MRRARPKAEIEEFMRDAEKPGGLRFSVNMGELREAALRAAGGEAFDYRGWTVSEHKVKARCVLTIKVDDAKAWRRYPDNPSQIVPMLPAGVDFAGAIVRVFPPHDASTEVIAGMRDLLARFGAIRTVVRPRAPAPAVILTDKRKALPRLAGRASMRSVVLGMAAEANAPDTALLCDFVEGCLVKAGL